MHKTRTVILLLIIALLIAARPSKVESEDKSSPRNVKPYSALQAEKWIENHPTTTTSTSLQLDRTTTTRASRSKPLSTSTTTVRIVVTPAPARSGSHRGYATAKECSSMVEHGGSYSRSSNPSHFGRYQFTRTLWKAYGGNPATWGSASPEEQDQVFERAWNSPGGSLNWTPYNHC